MTAIIRPLIIIGAAIMVTNVYRLVAFIRSTHDVLSFGSERDKRWMALALVQVVFFLMGYLYVVVLSDVDYGLLLGGQPTTHHFTTTEVFQRRDDDWKLIQFTFTALVH